MLVENPVIVGQNYTLKGGNPDHPLRAGLKPGTIVKVCRALGDNLFEVETPEKKITLVYGDNLDRGSFHVVPVKFIPTVPADRSYVRAEAGSGNDLEFRLKELLQQGADVELECSNTMVQRVAQLVSLNQYDVMAVAQPGANARYFFRAHTA